MTDYRSAAEQFVTEFLDYVYQYDIRDKLNMQTNKMERSPGVAKLIQKAEAVFPPRIKRGEEAPTLTAEQIDEAVKTSPNVVDTREEFSRRVAKNGGTHALLRALYKGEPDAIERVKEFFAAEDGEITFRPKDN